MTRVVTRLLFGLAALAALPLAQPARAVDAGQPAPQFALASLSGEGNVSIGAHRGKVVYVDFWASWCVPCRRSFPWMNQMHEKYAEHGLVIIGVNMDTNSSDAETFLKDYPARFTIVADPGGTLARQFEVEAMPSSYLIGRDGAIASQHLGFQVRQTDEYEATIREVLLSQ